MSRPLEGKFTSQVDTTRFARGIPGLRQASTTDHTGDGRDVYDGAARTLTDHRPSRFSAQDECCGQIQVHNALKIGRCFVQGPGDVGNTSAINQDVDAGCVLQNFGDEAFAIVLLREIGRPGSNLWFAHGKCRETLEPAGNGYYARTCLSKRQGYTLTNTTGCPGNYRSLSVETESIQQGHFRYCRLLAQALSF